MLLVICRTSPLHSGVTSLSMQVQEVWRALQDEFAVQPHGRGDRRERSAPPTAGGHIIPY